MEHKLWYDSPAKHFNQALPIGAGSFGALVYGDTQNEKLTLNHDTLWSGTPKDKCTTPLSKYFKEAQNLALKGDLKQAQKIIEQHLCTSFDESYLPLGNININFNHKYYTEYTRTLDLQNAIHTIKYKYENVTYKREYFCSHLDNIMIMKLNSDVQNKLNFELSIFSLLKYEVQKIEDDIIILKGICPTHVDPPYVHSENPIIYDENNKGIEFACAIKIITDGTVCIKNDVAKVSDATTVILMVGFLTGFVDYKTHPTPIDIKNIIEHIKNCSEKGYEKLYKNHLQDFHSLYNKCKLFIQNNNNNYSLPTDKRLLAYQSDKTDTGLCQLLFHYGRYLLISSSRKGTQPANLQGIWNEDIRAPWSSNYTLNINTEMNYWHAFITNLSECSLPAISMTKDLSQSGKNTAINLYDSTGFVVHHNTDLWRATNPVGANQQGSACYGFWPFASAWLCRIVYEYYIFTKDVEFLNTIALPILKSASEFYLNTLIDTPNGLNFVPSTSPENNFILDNITISVSKTSTMSESLMYDLFQNCIKLCKDAKDDFANTLENILPKLSTPKICKDGRLLEWDEAYTEAEIEHRHISHLYALHPGKLISLNKTPELSKACENSLKARGDGGTGWSLAWKINQWARLHNGEKALILLQNQLNYVDPNLSYSNVGGTYPNLFCAHPPFQIDGNFGACAGIAEMLLQSYDDEIYILPALPRLWKNGNIKGICTETGDILNIFWENCKPIHIEILPKTSSNKILIFKDFKKIVNLTANELFTFKNFS